MSGPHAPVMLREVLAAIAPRPGRLVVDGTFGAGGYSRAFLDAGAEVLAIDRDPSTRRFADDLLASFPDRFVWVNAAFSDMQAVLAARGRAGCDGVALDLGVSSMQLDEAERGFSFMRDGPLDMRMGAEGQTAADLVNTLDAEPLARILFEYGEERASRRVARALIRRREEQPFTRTADLAQSVETALGGRRGARTHPATRTFQALRIAVNDELGELERGLDAAEGVLSPGARLAVVSFQSLEDRAVKRFLAQRAGRVQAVSRHAPAVAAAGPPPTFVLLPGGAPSATQDEIVSNPRARSARLRAAERTTAPAWRRAA